MTASHQRRQTDDTQSDTAYRILKDKIVSLELPPATLLNEAELITTLGLGRTPIREALLRLSLENLVVILPRRGTLVADLNMSDLQKIFEIRLELEVCAARLAANRATPAQITQMEALLINAAEIIHPHDHHQLITLDHQFHQHVAQAAHNEFLEQTLERLYTHVLRLWYVSLHRVNRLAEAIGEHCDLLAAIKAGDSPRAAEIMRVHVAGFQNQFIATVVSKK